ncbi:putative NBD/HSP70 family sugar kinase [Microbacterium sp. AG1240]|uniref:ROK family protein n=1 Tax=Microbacterium sp. AG1240 TaxID=2183992 RepID=UPI000F254BD4|nr:ROK family protein [Microbacterium sp. AG1240]RKT31638.1 putative NBD/HSP70 family sugar kinase [Microbacterium sp. AG1240]
MIPHSQNTKLLPSDTRRHNRSLVLRTLYGASDISRADVARITSLSRITSSELVNGLVEDGLVYEVGARDSSGRPGKPATLLRINPRAFNVVGVDLSDPQRLTTALVSIDGDTLHQSVLPGELRGDAAFSAIVNAVATLKGKSTAPLSAIAIGTPGVVNEEGTVVEANNLDWRSFPLARRVRERFDVPTLVYNDANAAIMAEHDAGAGANLILVRIGIGLGAACLINGELVLGANFASGELGQLRIDDRGGARLESVVRTLIEDALAALSRGDDDAARKAQTEIGALLGRSLAPVISVLDVPELVIDARAGLDAAVIGDSVSREIKQHLALDSRRTLEIRGSSFGEGAVIRGVVARAIAHSLDWA